MKQKMTRFLNHENLENQLILLRKNHMISSNLPTKIREEPIITVFLVQPTQTGVRRIQSGYN